MRDDGEPVSASAGLRSRHQPSASAAGRWAMSGSETRAPEARCRVGEPGLTLRGFCSTLGAVGTGRRVGWDYVPPAGVVTPYPLQASRDGLRRWLGLWKWLGRVVRSSPCRDRSRAGPEAAPSTRLRRAQNTCRQVTQRPPARTWEPAGRYRGLRVCDGSDQPGFTAEVTAEIVRLVGRELPTRPREAVGIDAASVPWIVGRCWD